MMVQLVSDDIGALREIHDYGNKIGVKFID